MSEARGSFSFSDLWPLFKRRVVGFGVAFTLVFLAGCWLAMALPAIFRAHTTVLIERQQIPDSLVETTVTGYLQERLEVIRQRLMTPDTLFNLAKEMHLPGSDLSSKASGDEYDNARSEFVLNMIDSIDVETIDVQAEVARGGRSTSLMSVAFQVSYEDENPVIAAEVANKLTELFLQENINQRTEQAGKVTTFLSQADTKIKKEIAGIEAELTQLKRDHFDSLPDQIADTRQQLEQRKSDLTEINSEISYLENRMSQIVAKMEKTSRHAFTANSDVGVFLDPQLQLAKAKLDLAKALEIYTEDHPDVLQLKENIRDLEKNAGKPNVANKSISAPTNPEYLRLQEQFDEIEAKHSAMEGNRDQLKDSIVLLSEKARTNPAIEIKYNALLRHLDRAQQEYAELKDRTYSAELAQNLEASQQGDRFTLLSAATPPLLPDRPNRVGIILLSFFLALLAGLGTAAWREMGENIIRTPEDLKGIFGAPPIVIIPVIK